MKVERGVQDLRITAHYDGPMEGRKERWETDRVAHLE